MTDDVTIAVYDARAEEYRQLVSTTAASQDLMDFIALLPKGSHVLDLGCGPADASAHMRAAGLVPDPVDASPQMVALANEAHAIGARLATFDDITGEAIYDGIWANFSLLHAEEAELPRHMAALTRALKPSGAFHIGMKTGHGTARDAIGRRYTYVTVDGLHQLMADAGLTVTFTREGRERGMSGTLDPFVICRGVKDA